MTVMSQTVVYPVKYPLAVELDHFTSRISEDLHINSQHLAVLIQAKLRTRSRSKISVAQPVPTRYMQHTMH